MGGNFLCTKKQPGGRAFDCPQINIMKGKYQMEKFEYPVRTDEEGFYNVTQQVRDAVEKSGVQDGVCVIYSPHTTAGITINENADPNVVKDMLFGLKKTFPDRPEYRHMEGNTTAHLKASFMGSSATVLIENGGLVLGTWQGIYFCEFDGPRNRRFYVKVLGAFLRGKRGSAESGRAGGSAGLLGGFFAVRRRWEGFPSMGKSRGNR